MEKETKLEKMKNGDTILKELKTDGQVIILKILNDKNLVIFASWTGNNWQDYLYDLDNNKGYCLLSSSDWVSDGYGGMRYLYYDTYSYPGIDGDYFYWQSFENWQFLLKMIKVDEIIKANTQAFANTNDSAEKRYKIFSEICRKKTITIFSKITSFTNLVKHCNIFIWEDDRNYDTTSTDIYGFNILTEKEFPICTEIGYQKSIILKGDRIFWEDYRNIKRKGYEKYCYDLKNNTEKLIPYAEKVIGDCTWTANKDFVCYSGKTTYPEEYAKGIYIYNLNTGVTEKITDKNIGNLKIFYNSDEDSWEYYSVWPSQIFISEPDKNNDFYIAWGEISGFKFRNSKNDSTVVAYQKYSEISKPTKYIEKTSSSGGCQSIQGLSNSGIAWINHLGNKEPGNRFTSNLKIFQFENKIDITIEDVYKEELFDEICQINDSYAVWPPIDKQEWRAINLRYMKIR